MSDGEAGVPAGWYPTPDGSQRYWDGNAWTEHVAPAAGTAPAAGHVVTGGVTSDERTMGMLAHVLGIVASFLGPLVIYLVKKDESPFIRHHAAEALNFTISMFVYFTVWIIASTVLLLVIVGFFMFLLLPVAAIGVLVLQIMAAVAANRGEYYRYPLTIRLIS